MSAPARILVLSACLLTGAWTACRGAIVVHWLDEPIVVGNFNVWTDTHQLDLDGNGIIDFLISCDWNIAVGFYSEGENRYLIHQDPPPNIGGPIAALEEGFEIGPESEGPELIWFGDDYDYWSTLMMEFDTGRSGEFWKDPEEWGPPWDPRSPAGMRTHIGVEFEIDSVMHYGWIEVQGHWAYPSALVWGWGYESTPGVGIPAGAVAIPEPSSLLLLAGGAFSLLVAARRKNLRRETGE